jgi:hypothetical protein
MGTRRDPIRYPDHSQERTLLEGEMTVTGTGYVTIDEPLKRSRALLVHSEEAIMVRFKEASSPCPPCADGVPDSVDWEIVERRRELKLKIKWHVACARSICWKIFEVD